LITNKPSTLYRKHSLTILTACLGTTMLCSFFVWGPPTILYSSIAIIICLATCYLLYGIISIPSIIISIAFIPSLSIFFAYIYNRPYINWRNHWLQDELLWGETSVYLSLVSIVFALSILVTFNKKTSIAFISPALPCYLGRFSYTILSLASLFFFWLAEPSFQTILTTPYEEVMQDRFKNTQYAGSLGILCWLPLLATYLTKLTLKKGATKDRLFSNLFLIVTATIIIWLALHSRRNELMAIGISLIISIKYMKGTLLAIIFSGLFLALLVSVGTIRGLSLEGYIEKNYPSNTALPRGEPSRAELKNKIKSLPGGASNVYMTHLTTVHFFDKRPLLHGETFSNYLFTLLPSNLYRIFDTKHPQYYYQHVLQNYDYNGGTYLGAVFYGNFGMIGAVLFGLFIGLYILLSTRFLSAPNIVLQVTGFFILGMASRGMWYELITIIKPLVIVLLPAYILFNAYLRKATKHSKSKYKNYLEWAPCFDPITNSPSQLAPKSTQAKRD
jgi:hypothetical protein